MSQTMKPAESRLGVVIKVCDANIIWSDENMCVWVCCWQKIFGLQYNSVGWKGVCVCVCVCECPVNENRPKSDSLLCRRVFAAKDVCALCWCNCCALYPICNSPSFVLPGVSKCCVSPNCGLPLLTTPPCSKVCCTSTHFTMVVKATRAGIPWNWDTLELWVLTIDLAEENECHITGL